MVDIEEMVALQEVDLQLDLVKRRLGELDEQLLAPDAHRTLSEELAAQTARLQEAKQGRKSVEDEVAVLRAKIEAEDAKLYSGQITDAKELRHLQEEVFALRRGLKAQEDRLLARIDEEEHEQEASAYLKTLKKKSEAAWAKRHTALQAQRDTAQAEATLIGADVAELRGELAQAELSVYDTHRERQQIAIAASTGGICGACRLALPTTIINRARRGAVVVNCPACDCIVYIR
ncbi:MAG: putative nucleic acid-binding protein, contains Zn-ribbon domain [Chloroflexi bacterium]|nr:MAG: putative nucleic acid-binding protein, contains Zn-ribbon domain [Chloroflexota bacterium]